MSGWRIIKSFVLFALLLAFLAPASQSAGSNVADSTVLVVDDERVTADEILYLLGVQSGGGGSAAALIAGQMTSEEMEAFLEQVSRAILFSKGAIIRGHHLDPGVAARIRWGRINALAEAYVGSMASSLTFTEKQLRAYFDEHREKYVQKEMARVRHILTRTEDQGRTALLRLLTSDPFSRVASELSSDPISAEKGGDLGWIVRGELPEPLDSAVFSAPPLSPSGPVQTEYGFHVFEVQEYKRPRPLTFEEVRETVRTEMVEIRMASEAASLRERFPVHTDITALREGLSR
ncbi:MAG: peptidylprolyl isomerase [Aminobacteriaceae bacterium]